MLPQLKKNFRVNSDTIHLQLKEGASGMKLPLRLSKHSHRGNMTFPPWEPNVPIGGTKALPYPKPAINYKYD